MNPPVAGSVVLIQGDARALPLADASVDLIVTSPPYFGLRSYTDGGQHYDGQIGAEPTPAAYIDALIDCTREWMRILKPCGSLWVNLGDKYVADNRGSGSDLKRGAAKYAPAGPSGFLGRETARQKSLMGLPWRYALRCIDDLGLILRAEVVWSKPNGLPESVTDRVRRSHEQWFHFTMQPRYFSAVDEIRVPAVRTDRRVGVAAYLTGVMPGKVGHTGLETRANHPLGSLPGSVWEIASQPLTVPAELGVDHFAAFPMEWPRRLIQGWSPREVCTACGEGRRPVTARSHSKAGGARERPTLGHVTVTGQTDHREGIRLALSVTVTGYACACPDTLAPSTPGVVLDPFGGTGTTALVASVLGRRGISVDASADYCRIAQWRTADPRQRARAAQSRPPRAQKPAPPDSQLPLIAEA